MILSTYRIWLLISLFLFHIYLIFLEPKVVYLYFDILFISIFIGKTIWNAHEFPNFLYKVSGIIPFFCAMYGMVLFEEMIAALVNNLIEGFNIWIFILRIGQFWLFNILAFTPIIVSIFIFHYLRFFSSRQLLIGAAIYGIMGEGIGMTLFTNLIFFLVYSPIVIYIYYMILSPGMYFLSANQTKTLRTGLIRYIYALLIGILLILFFSSILGFLRDRYPQLFPPCEMIACNKK